ncbi:hypothetical protein QFW96_03835 [Saccharopolyspora sp. TS4A08]|uniref:Squalene cyclase C-terminal domain-containing protein n=1 Tax=Saccharopolyspora ipomoeae TaxID=3042027 RepID=A0ABT6PI93_9PSEU|nr:hypothetical protein [Saccharopolyspora sp. TS4A08]MDI2027721.1 hypothetical protein [Saccharopolyspora sp. TS4A08]
MTLFQQTAERALDYVRKQIGPDGAPSVEMSFDPSFGESFTGREAREKLTETLGADPGFTLADEAFSAMVSLMLLASTDARPDRELIAPLFEQVERCRWKRRYRFLPESGLPADTDCTAMATGALHELGMLRVPDLQAAVRELTVAASHEPADSDDLWPWVHLVYWEDGAEPGTLSRGRKHDPVVSANALYTLHLAGTPERMEERAVRDATTRYLVAHLESGRWSGGTRYYPSPRAFLHALSRVCARHPEEAAALLGPARKALAGLGEAENALEIALHALAADNLGVSDGQDERRTRLAESQDSDGSWPAGAYYRMGRFAVHFGSRYLTTVFAMRALREVR